MTKLTDQRTAIDRAMFDPDSAEVPYKDKPMTDLMKTRGELEKKLGAVEAEWLAASEALETAEAAE
jgi:ATP-binding cassette subfamily F protein 3